MCRFSAIQAHTDSFRVQFGCGPILPVDICSYLLTVSRPISTVSVSFEHRTTSMFLSTELHCFFIRSYCSLFVGARLSRYTSAYSLVVRYCSKSSRHRDRKMKLVTFSSPGDEVMVHRQYFTAGNFHLAKSPFLVAWHSGRTSVSGRRTSPVLRSTCS